MATLWDQFRAKKFSREKSADGTIECQDWKVGLPRCRVKSVSPDLAHIKGREARPDLYFSDSNLVWLTRACHDILDGRDTDTTVRQAADDAKRRVEEAARSGKILGLQSRFAKTGQGHSGTKIYSSVSDRNAPILARKEKGTF
jgi:hypothetical protein